MWVTRNLLNFFAYLLLDFSKQVIIFELVRASSYMIENTTHRLRIFNIIIRRKLLSVIKILKISKVLNI